MCHISTCPVIKYAVVNSTLLDFLAVSVNKKIYMGWEPIGGIQAIDAGGGFREYCQAMIFRDSPNKVVSKQDQD
ncbi:MAG: hypothetical protein U5L07_07855 [Desulfobacterales bacterium]|nr:hypothetical protein [Desulfobacterales bacterium]